MNVYLDFNLVDFQLCHAIVFYKFCLTEFGLDNLVLNFLATFSSFPELWITAFNLQVCFRGLSYIRRNCTVCVWITYSPFNARYKPALICIMSLKLWNLCNFH